jgi:hypothetical protein
LWTKRKIVVKFLSGLSEISRKVRMTNFKKKIYFKNMVCISGRRTIKNNNNNKNKFFFFIMFSGIINLKSITKIVKFIQF